MDPKAYLARLRSEGGGSDPKAYLARLKESNSPEVLDVAGAARTAAEQVGNTVTLGYAPQIAAGIGRIMPDPNAGLDEKLRAQGFNVQNAPEQDYMALRDENLRGMAEREKQFPKAALAGKAAGVIASGALMGGALGATKGATTLARMGNAAKTGAALGAVANPGDVEGEMDPLQWEARLKNAGAGLVLGGLAQGAAEGAGPLLTAVRNWAGKKAALKATRALGRPTPTQAARMAETGQDVALGRELLDEGAIPVLGTPGRIQGRVEALKEKAGKQIGQIVDSAGDAKLVDSQKIGIEILDSPELTQLRKTPGMESAVAAIEKQVETLAKNGELTMKEAQALRQGIDRSINFNKAVPDMRGAQEGLYMQRTAVRNAMNEGINSLPNAPAKNALLKANRKYGNLSEASDILEREVGRQQANRAISLTDTIAGAAGATTGSPLASIALGALNKAGRTFGNSMQARGYDAASKLSGLGALVGRYARSASPASQAMLNRILVPGGKFQESEFNELLNDSETMKLLGDNPRLLDQIQNDKLKAAILRKLGRNPAGSAMQRRLGQ